MPLLRHAFQVLQNWHLAQAADPTPWHHIKDQTSYIMPGIASPSTGTLQSTHTLQPASDAAASMGPSAAVVGPSAAVVVIPPTPVVPPPGSISGFPVLPMQSCPPIQDNLAPMPAQLPILPSAFTPLPPLTHSPATSNHLSSRPLSSHVPDGPQPQSTVTSNGVDDVMPIDGKQAL
jgi:hypothetical protein